MGKRAVSPVRTSLAADSVGREHGLDALLKRPTDVARETSASMPLPPDISAKLDFAADPIAVSAVAEAHRLACGYQANAAFATETSRIDPLPHQRIAVYQHMLPQPRALFAGRRRRRGQDDHVRAVYPRDAHPPSGPTGYDHSSRRSD